MNPCFRSMCCAGLDSVNASELPFTWGKVWSKVYGQMDRWTDGQMTWSGGGEEEGLPGWATTYSWILAANRDEGSLQYFRSPGPLFPFFLPHSLSLCPSVPLSLCPSVPPSPLLLCSCSSLLFPDYPALSSLGLCLRQCFLLSFYI